MFWTYKYISPRRWRCGGWFFLSHRLFLQPHKSSASFLLLFFLQYTQAHAFHLNVSSCLRYDLSQNQFAAHRLSCMCKRRAGNFRRSAKWKKVITLKLIKHRFPSWDPVRKHTWHYTAVTHSVHNSQWVYVCVCVVCVRVKSVYWPWLCPQYLVRLGKSVPNWTLSRPECA